jgi:uncharacterized membrane protein YkvA (DUF1232 family)
MKNLLMFLPNLIALCGRLLTDRRVPRAEKVLFAGAVVYALIPLDLVPDLIPFVGQVDDTYLIAMTLLRLIKRTDDRVVREHWRGGGDIVQLAEAIVGLAPKLLPHRVRRVLSARVENSTRGIQDTIEAVRNAKPVVVELPEEEASPAGR